jgi:hypothetical protein
LESCFKVSDASGQGLGYFYFRDPPIVGTSGDLTRDEARRMATNFAELPNLLRK